jgi:hypothetical protein
MVIYYTPIIMPEDRLNSSWLYACMRWIDICRDLISLGPLKNRSKNGLNLHYIGKVEIKGADLNSGRDELVKQAVAVITIEGVKGTKHTYN